MVIAGPSSLDLYLKSSARDTDLQVTLSEVRPDGNETYVQNGWLRASHRKLDARRSTSLDPFPTHLQPDAAPLPHGRFALVRVPIFPVAHAFRAGSRIRVTVEATGGDRPRWDFATVDKGRTSNTVALGGRARLEASCCRSSPARPPRARRCRGDGAPRPAEPALRRRLERRLSGCRLLGYARRAWPRIFGATGKSSSVGWNVKCSIDWTSKPARAIAASVSRLVRQPPMARSQSPLASRPRWSSAARRRREMTCS